MKFDFKEILLAALTQTAEQVEEVSIVQALQALHDSDTAIWTEVCAALELAAIKLQPHVKGKFAAALIDGLKISVKESRDANPA